MEYKLQWKILDCGQWDRAECESNVDIRTKLFEKLQIQSEGNMLDPLGKFGHLDTQN